MTPEEQQIAIEKVCGKCRITLKTYPGYGGEQPLWSWCCKGPVTRTGTHFESSCCDPTVGYNNPIYKCDFCGKECNVSVAPVTEVSAKDSLDYLHDLNAMHQAETALTLEQRRIYVLVLEELLCPDFLSNGSDDPNDILFADVHAAIAPRREALLRTLGLWTS